MRTWKIAGINFDHLHMGDNLRMAHEHPQVELVALCDQQPERMATAAENFGVPPESLYTDYRECLEKSQPDLVLLCPATATHGDWVERVAPYNVHAIVEKPFAASVAEADRMIAAMKDSQRRLAINWPLRWVASHAHTKELIEQGRIGEPLEVHYYDGNRGPLWHVADKREVDAETVARNKPSSWFYKREFGGGSMLDYLGYGTTLGTWYLNGKTPLEITTMLDQPPGLEVDEHSITVVRYETGLSKFETRWGTFSDPWTHQPQPKCGFVVVGTRGTISSYDYEPTVFVQTEKKPAGEVVAAPPLLPPFQNPVQYVLHCLENDLPIEGPLSPETSRIGQQIVDAAILSAQQKRTVPFPVTS